MSTVAKKSWTLRPLGALNASASFTLIELLVVISVIAILTSILLPAIGRARTEGKRIACASNFRQISLALYSYSGDYNGFFPASEATRSQWQIDCRGEWIVQSSVYMGSSTNPLAVDLTTYDKLVPLRSSPRGLFLCPETTSLSGVMRWSYNPTVCVSSLEAFQAGATGGYEAYYSSDLVGQKTPKPVLKILPGGVLFVDAFVYPGATSYCPADFNFPWYYKASDYYSMWGVAGRHGSRANFLFLDGSVRAFASFPYAGWRDFDNNWIPK